MGARSFLLAVSSCFPQESGLDQAAQGIVSLDVGTMLKEHWVECDQGEQSTALPRRFTVSPILSYFKALLWDS